MTRPEDMTARARRVAEELLGTCRALHDVASEEEQADADFCAALDAEVFCCSECDWWCERCEESEDEEGVCIECAPEEEG